MGLFDVLVDGEWIRIEDNTIDPYEIIYKKDGSIHQMGIGIIMDYCSPNLYSNFSIQNDDGYSSMDNGLALVPGKFVKLPDGTSLKWNNSRVDYYSTVTDPNRRPEALEIARHIATLMNGFTKVANENLSELAKSLVYQGRRHRRLTKC